jgi:hypothetical protein
MVGVICDRGASAARAAQEGAFARGGAPGAVQVVAASPEQRAAAAPDVNTEISIRSITTEQNAETVVALIGGCVEILTVGGYADAADEPRKPNRVAE